MTALHHAFGRSAVLWRGGDVKQQLKLLSSTHHWVTGHSKKNLTAATMRVGVMSSSTCGSGADAIHARALVIGAPEGKMTDPPGRASRHSLFFSKISHSTRRSVPGDLLVHPGCVHSLSLPPSLHDPDQDALSVEVLLATSQYSSDTLCRRLDVI